MVRTALLGCFVILTTALALPGAARIAQAAPIAQPGAAPDLAGPDLAAEPAAYNGGKYRPCPGQNRPYYFAWNPGRYDSWGKYGPYKHKHYGGQRWHDLNYNGCSPWWQPAPYGAAAARKAFKDARDNPHVRWCLERYRTYNPRTDTFIGYDGRQRRCLGPS